MSTNVTHLLLLKGWVENGSVCIQHVMVESPADIARVTKLLQVERDPQEFATSALVVSHTVDFLSDTNSNIKTFEVLDGTLIQQDESGEWHHAQQGNIGSSLDYFLKDTIVTRISPMLMRRQASSLISGETT